MASSDLNSIRILANSDFIFIWSLANSDPIFIWILANSDLVFMKSELASGQGPNWLRSESSKVRIDHSWTELTKVRIVQGPNCPTFH